ncbi:MAG: LamG domain-containing protein [Acidobacteriota bacterium]
MPRFSFLGVAILATLTATPVLGTPTFTKQTIESGIKSVPVTAADMDKDGDMDVVALDPASQRISWWRNNNSDATQWTKVATESSSSGVTQLSTGSLSSDDDVDIAYRRALFGQLETARNVFGHGNTWGVSRVANEVDAFEMGDINNDGATDIVAVRSSSSRVVWYQRTDISGLNWLQRNVVLSYDSPKLAHPFDADGDGDLDLAIFGEDSALGGLSIYFNVHGNGIAWERHLIEDLPSASLTALTSGDLDRDGDPDLAAIIDGSSIGWWENQGEGAAWHFRSLDSSSLQEPAQLAVEDLDADGDLDLAVTDTAAHRIFWFESTGVGFRARTLGTLSGASGLALKDMDGNGSIDVVASSVNGGDLVWFRSGGTGTNSCVDVPPGAFAWYGFDEQRGTTSRDLLHGNNGWHVNGPSPITFGRVGGALRLDGFNDYVEVNTDSNNNLGVEDFTIEGWIKTDDAYGTFVSKRDWVDGRYFGYLFGLWNGRLVVGMGDVDRNSIQFVVPRNPTVYDGEWRHVAVGVDRNMRNGGRVYLDGVLIHTFDPTGVRGRLESRKNLQFGRETNSGGIRFDGMLDEMTLYSRALTGAEIFAIFNAGGRGKCKGAGDVAPPRLECANLGPGIHRCEASYAGGLPPYEFNWTYGGNGTMSAFGSTAVVEMGHCSNGGGGITVQVTDRDGEVRSVSRFLLCTGDCAPGAICLN